MEWPLFSKALPDGELPVAFPILILLTFFTAGLLVGGITRSWWGMFYPAGAFVLLVFPVLTGDEGQDMGQSSAFVLFVLIFVLPAALGIAVGVSGRKAIAQWK